MVILFKKVNIAVFLNEYGLLVIYIPLLVLLTYMGFTQKVRLLNKWTMVNKLGLGILQGGYIKKDNL